MKFISNLFLEFDSIVTNKSETANKCNVFVTNIGSNLENNIKYKGIHDHTYFFCDLMTL